MIIDVDDFLEHHGVKGQKWGVRGAKAASVARTVGRGAKRTGRFAREHKKTVAVIAVAAATTAGAVYTRRYFQRAQVRSLASVVQANRSRRAEEVARMFAMGRGREANNLLYYHDRLNVSDAIRLNEQTHEIFRSNGIIPRGIVFRSTGTGPGDVFRGLNDV